MDAGTMKAIVAGLLAWLGTHSTYPPADETPAIALVPHSYIEELACGARCDVLGVYPDGNLVYVDSALKPETNICARSVILHELVHYLQDRNERFINLPPVIRWHVREVEAYAFQRQYLHENGIKAAEQPRLYLGAVMGPAC